MNVSISSSHDAKTSSSQPQAMPVGLANTGTTGKKRKSEPQVGASTPTQNAEQAPPPPKKKMKASVKPSQPSGPATVTAMERNHGAPSKTKGMDSAKKHPTGDESDHASVGANPAHPAKKAKVDKSAALTRVPIRRSGKIILNFWS